MKYTLPFLLLCHGILLAMESQHNHFVRIISDKDVISGEHIVQEFNKLDETQLQKLAQIHTENNPALLLLALQYKRPEAARLLIAQGKADVTVETTTGHFTTLYYAIKNQLDNDLIHLLLHHGADPNTYSNFCLTNIQNILSEEIVSLLLLYGGRLSYLLSEETAVQLYNQTKSPLLKKITKHVLIHYYNERVQEYLIIGSRYKDNNYSRLHQHYDSQVLLNMGKFFTLLDKAVGTPQRNEIYSLLNTALDEASKDVTHYITDTDNTTDIPTLWYVSSQGLYDQVKPMLSYQNLFMQDSSGETLCTLLQKILQRKSLPEEHKAIYEKIAKLCGKRVYRFILLLRNKLSGTHIASLPPHDIWLLIASFIVGLPIDVIKQPL
jgi:ankyrin repeat protein